MFTFFANIFFSGLSRLSFLSFSAFIRDFVPVCRIPDFRVPVCLLMQAVSVELGLCVVVHVFRGHVMKSGELVHAHHVGRVLVRQGRMHLVHGHGVHGGHLVLLLPLHPPVLEPDLDLPFRQAEGVGDLDSPSSGQVSIEVELLLQLQGLVSGVRGSLSLCFAVLIHCI